MSAGQETEERKDTDGGETRRHGREARSTEGHREESKEDREEALIR
jgi:hypothetical protein